MRSPIWLVSILLFNLPMPAPAMENISELLKPLPNEFQVPSISVAVVVEGKTVAVGAAGVRKRGFPEEVTIQDRYHLGSCTKSMTATLAAILVREGRIRWESTVEEMFPNLPIHESYRKATLRDLTTNTAGCPKDIPPPLWVKLWMNQGSAREQRNQLVEGLLTSPARYAPGKGEEYSNAGFSVAGAMMEQATGTDYERLLRDKIFTPLGMTSAGFRAPATAGQVDQPYGHNPNPVEPEPRGDNPRGIAPAGAVHCTMEDWAKYAQLHLGDFPKILSAEEIALLHSPPKSNPGYAAGWIVTQRPWAGGIALTHAGSNTMFYAVIWLAPAKHFAVVAATNTGEKNGFGACDKAASLMIQKYLPGKP